MIRLKVHRETCSGFGNCVLASGTIFGRDDEGFVVLERAAVGDDELEAVQQAVYNCPTDSIEFSRRDGEDSSAV
jgi:ferredoxin